LTLLAACPAPPAVPSVETKPRLVVLLVIDQFPEWSFELKRPELRHGFARLLADGEWHVGRHPSAATLTASGHALLGTGQPPARSGIIANEWWSRELERVVKPTEDEHGHTTTQWLRVPALGDAIAAAHTGAKAVAVSLKSRASILPLGHHGLPIYLDEHTTTWTTHGPAPAWLADYARTHPIEPAVWTPLETTKTVADVPDDQPGETGGHGFGATFPHDPRTTKHPAHTVFTMPLGNEIVLDTALAAIDHEQLGRDRIPDLLVISLSAHDYIAHAWGHESWEMWDSELRLDASLDKFLDALDREIGKNKWAMIVTSDHGGSPLPDRVGGGRYTFEQLQAAANQAASAVLGAGTWIASAHYPFVYFTKEARAQDPKELANAIKKVVFALRAFPGLERVDRVDSVAGHCETRRGDDRALCLAFDPERSGEIFYMPASGWVMEEDDERLATAHGSLHDYDRLVPAILLPLPRTRHAAPAAPGPEIEMTAIAPLLASWLGVQNPAALR